VCTILYKTRQYKPHFRHENENSSLHGTKINTCRAKIRSSTVSLTVNRKTVTGRVCPIRCALSMAWSSVVGFHHRSSMRTWQAATMFRPRLAAFKDIIITDTWKTTDPAYHNILIQDTKRNIYYHWISNSKY